MSSRNPTHLIRFHPRSALKSTLFSLALFGSIALSLADAASRPLSYFTPQAEIDSTALVDGFHNPPQEALLRVWWFWLNGVATKASITSDPEAMKESGIGGVVVCDNGANNSPEGAVFMSEEWLELFAHVIAEATRLGIEVSANIQSGCGDPGHPNVANDNGMKEIVSSTTQSSGPAPVAVQLPKTKANRII